MTGTTGTTVYLDGHWVPDDQARVSIFDRSFLYGDGLFETLRVYGGRFLLWTEHWSRFARGSDALGIRRPEEESRVRAIAQELLDRNQMTDAVVRFHLSRGVGNAGIRRAAPITVPSSPPIPHRRWMPSHQRRGDCAPPRFDSRCQTLSRPTRQPTNSSKSSLAPKPSPWARMTPYF